MPFGAWIHAGDPAKGEYVPASHTVHEALPAFAAEPAPHVVHEVEPDDDEKVPAGHCVQDVPPT